MSAPPATSSQAKRQLGGTMATNVAIAVIGLITGSLSARLLGPVGRGELAAIQTLANLVGMIALAGLPSGVAYFTARQSTLRRDTFFTASVLLAGLAAIGVVVGIVLVPVVLREQSALVRTTAVVYLAFIPLQALQIAAVAGLWGMQRFRSWNLVRLAPALCWLGALLVAAYWDRSPRAASLTYLWLYAATTPIAIVLFSYHSSGRFRFRMDRVRELVTYSLPTAIAGVPSAMNLRLDQALMAALLPPSSLGLYAVSVAWSGALAPATSAVASVLFPRLASRQASEAADTLGRGLRITVLIAVSGTVVLGALTPVALRVLFGSPFSAATPAAVLLVIAAAFSALNGVLEESLRGLGGVRWPLYGQLAALPVTIGLLLVLLRPWGLVGAAVASLLAYATTTAVLGIGAARITGRSVRGLFLPRRADLQVAVGAIRSFAEWARTSAQRLNSEDPH